MIQKTMNFIFKKNRLFKGRSIHSNRTPRGGGDALPYMGYIGTCRGIGYGF